MFSIFFIERLITWYGQIEDAAVWCKYYAVNPMNVKCPTISWRALTEQITKVVDAKKILFENSASTAKEGCLALPPSVEESIVVVETRDQFLNFSNDLFSRVAAAEERGQRLVGLDAEYRPLSVCAVEKVALMQVATLEKVFLLDFLALEVQLFETDWRLFCSKLFCDSSALKLGFDFRGDLQVLRRTLPFCTDLFDSTTNLICLSKLTYTLFRQDPRFLDEFNDRTGKTEAEANKESFLAFGSGTTNSVVASSSSGVCLDNSVETADEEVADPRTQFTFGLSHLAHYFLGKPLDKGEQVSNWCQRPLAAEQRRYASLDAYCQLGIFLVMRDKAERMMDTIDFGRAVSHSEAAFDKRLTGNQKLQGDAVRARDRAAEKKRRADKYFDELIQKSRQISEGDRPISVKDISFAVDMSIAGVAKHLRKCGIDTEVIESKEHRSRVIEQICQKKHRTLLSCGRAFQELLPVLGPQHVVCVPSVSREKSASPQQILAWLLGHFKIVVRDEDVFARCMKCNQGSFLLVPGPLMLIMADAILGPATKEWRAEIRLRLDALRQRILDGECEDANCASLQITPSSELVILSNGGLDVFSGRIYDMNQVATETMIEVNQIPDRDKVIQSDRLFQVCNGCGQVYWPGAHMRSYKLNLAKLLPEDAFVGNNDDG